MATKPLIVKTLEQKSKTYQILPDRVQQKIVPLYPVIKDIKTPCQ